MDSKSDKTLRDEKMKTKKKINKTTNKNTSKRAGVCMSA